MDIKFLKDKDVALRIGDFMTGPNAFEQTWYPNEKAIVMKAALDSIGSEKHRYWYVENESGDIIGAIGVRENKYSNGGYEMDSDYLAVHKDYRNQGIAGRLLGEMEEFVKQGGGRYIHILACDISSYSAARAFYQKHGYKKVAEIPNYYLPSEGRVDFYKELIK